ncbi:MAG: hypothetical protein JW940_37580 [Polyangiaceae bacterium]|nr:hypothetical protein [Polyangiaceae bacterium]
MNGMPIQVLLVPLIGLVVVAYMLVMRYKRVTTSDQQYSNYRAGELAQRLGLQLLSGDPGFNLFIIHTDQQVLNGPTDKKPVDVNIKMAGSPQGVPLELIYVYNVTQKTGFDVIRRETLFDCRMIAHTRQPFPSFEVLSRNTAMGPIQQILPLPAVPTGNPIVDAAYLVATGEPRLAQLLGTLIPGFAQLDQNRNGIHLVGEGTSISFVMQQNTAPLVANALYYAESMAMNLSQVAKAVGG